jgi:hypothetical protein
MVYPTRKQPFESLTSIDERVDFIHGQISESQVSLDDIRQRIGLPTMAATTRELVLRQTVPPLQGYVVGKGSPLTGKILQVMRHWPGGCNALVDLAVGHGDTWLLPNETDMFVALNNATPVVNVDEPVYKSEELWMVVRNTDAINAHAISVTFIIQGE